MKLFLDESLSPDFAWRLNRRGIDVIHPLHVGRRGEPDYVVLRRCIEEDRVLATQNKRDFKALLRSVDLHPRLIFLPSMKREASWLVLMTALTKIGEQPDPDDYMVNRVVEVTRDGTFASFLLPPLP